MLNLEANLQKTQARLGLAMQHINEMAFEKSVMEQQLAEWKNKISTHVSNVREMAMIKQREKDLLQRARRDREREFRTLKENFEKEKNSLLKEKKSYEEKTPSKTSASLRVNPPKASRRWSKMSFVAAKITMMRYITTKTSSVPTRRR